MTRGRNYTLSGRPSSANENISVLGYTGQLEDNNPRTMWHMQIPAFPHPVVVLACFEQHVPTSKEHDPNQRTDTNDIVAPPRWVLPNFGLPWT